MYSRTTHQNGKIIKSISLENSWLHVNGSFFHHLQRHNTTELFFKFCLVQGFMHRAGVYFIFITKPKGVGLHVIYEDMRF